MEVSVFKMIENFIQEKKIKHTWLIIFLCMALVVALTTAGALKLTGIAQTRTLTVLNCPAEIHEHVDGCYDIGENLSCGYADFVVHTHSLDCYFDDVLTCELPVIEAHEHTEDCYSQEEYLICGQTQSKESDGEDHIHTDECYETRETLSCDKEDILLHTHTAECFKEAVFDENGTMISLTSQLPEDVTVPDTWTRDMVPACGHLQIEEHIHGAGCLDTVKFTPEEAEAYTDSMGDDETQTDTDSNWNGTLEGMGRKDIGNDDGTKTVVEQLTWSATINFPNDDTWTDFIYTDSFRQTMTGWVLQENGEKTWEEDHLIHHYRTLSRLDKELNDSLSFWLAQSDLENDLTYTFIYKDQDGNEVTDDSAEVIYFEIHFKREAGKNLHGQSINIDYTSLVDTEDFVNNTNYNIDNDFTLPEFTGTGNFCFRYTDHISNETETGDISVQNVWLNVEGDPQTDNLPDNVEMVLKQYAFKGGIYLTEKPEDTKNWCELTLRIEQGSEDNQHDVWIKTLDEEILGEKTATVWIPRNSQVQLSADDRASTWNYTFNVKNVSAYELTIPVDTNINSIFLSVIGKAPTGFIPTGDFTKYGGTITLNGDDDDWSHTWEQLPLDDGNDTRYVYTVEQEEVPDGYYTNVENDGEGTFTVTNRKSMEPGKITVEKIWVDDEGYPLAIHPDSVEIELQKRSSADDEWDTVENGRITLPNDKGEWTASWTGLEDGEYRVVEKKIDGYLVSYAYSTYDDQGNRHTSSTSLSGNAGFATVVNVKTLADDGDIVVVKVWEYEDGTPDTSHPGSVDIVIKRARMSPPEESEPSSEPETDLSEPNTSETVTSVTDSSEPNTSETVTSVTDTSETVTSGTDTPEMSTSKTDTSSNSSIFDRIPNTDDNSKLIPYIIAAVISGILFVTFACAASKAGRRKKKTTEDNIDE
ncbi:MAG: Cna B-type domain-containing protein [Oscillospiraceae bacterium]|nr:Cna B-type domain-containing protein [Oscillospiraceae bacterium]